MIDPDTGNFTASQLEEQAAKLKLAAKEAKKREAAEAKKKEGERLSAFEDARATLNTKAKAFAKSGGKGTTEAEELNAAMLALDAAANALAGNAVPA